MNLLDRHIFKSVLFTCVAAVGVFAFVLMLGNVIKDLLPYVLAGQLAFGTFARLVFLLVPFVVAFALPMGMLTGVLLTIGRISADSEITAMRTAGLSLFRIARPIIILGLLGAAAGLYANFESMPWARVEYDKELSVAVQNSPVNILVPKTFIRNFNGLVIYVGERKGDVLSDLWIWRLDKQSRVIQLIKAESARAQYVRAENEVRLTLNNAKFTDLNDKNPENVMAESPNIGDFQETVEPVILPLDQLFSHGPARQKLQWMTLHELEAQEAKVAAQPVAPGLEKEHARDVMKVKMVIQDKFTMSLAVLSFALIGIPLGVRVSRKETSANLGLAVILFLSYYLLVVMINWLDRHPEYRPDLLYWMPNVIFIGLAIWLFRRADRAT